MCKISLRARKMKVPMVSIYSFPRRLSKQNKMKKWKQPLTIPNNQLGDPLINQPFGGGMKNIIPFLLGIVYGIGFTRPGKLPHNHGKSPWRMGKSTISMAMFNSFLFVITRGYHWKSLAIHPHPSPRCPAAAIRERREVAPLHLQSQDEAACLGIAAAEKPRVSFDASARSSRRTGPGTSKLGAKNQELNR